MFLTLDEIGEEPDHDELIWNFVGRMDFVRQPFQVVTIDPVEWFERKNSNGESLQDIFGEHAEGWQKRLVKRYRSLIRKNQDIGYLVLHSGSKVVVDGQHRIVALALEGVRSYAKVVDLSKPQRQ